jgi:hypothetical protein
MTGVKLSQIVEQAPEAPEQNSKAVVLAAQAADQDKFDAKFFT